MPFWRKNQEEGFSDLEKWGEEHLGGHSRYIRTPVTAKMVEETLRQKLEGEQAAILFEELCDSADLPTTIVEAPSTEGTLKKAVEQAREAFPNRGEHSQDSTKLIVLQHLPNGTVTVSAGEIPANIVTEAQKIAGIKGITNEGKAEPEMRQWRNHALGQFENGENNFVAIVIDRGFTVAVVEEK